jgi:hyaluronoglucosaminidase
VPRPVAVRGVIEGFYGPPWSHDARLALVDFLAARQMNAYVYAPKSDPKHRDAWRDPYEAVDADRFRELAGHCRQAGVRFGFAISPGLDIDYASATDRDALAAKLDPLLAAGVDWIVLALDDIANRPGLATEQADLVGWLVAHAPARVTLVPTEYVGTNPSAYLSALATELPDGVDVMWTGPTVCSPRIDAEDARAWRAALGDHPLILWDNFPVNDAVMEAELHLGPYTGRSAALSDELDGVLCNPMLQPHASKVPLATAAAYLADPSGYDPAAAWARALDDVGGPRAAALGALARACADGPLAAPGELALHELVEHVERDARDPGWPETLGHARDELTALHDAAGAYAEAADDPLATELAPWLEQATREAEAGLAALRLVQATRPVAVREADGRGRAAAPDAEAAMIHAFGALFAWSGARQGRMVVGGPRFATYAAIVQLPTGEPALDIDLALREDASAIDRLCRFALHEYRDALPDMGAPLCARAGLDSYAVEPDGRFDVPPEVPIVVSWGRQLTRADAPSSPPFGDARLR